MTGVLNLTTEVVEVFDDDELRHSVVLSCGGLEVWRSRPAFMPFDEDPAAYAAEIVARHLAQVLDS